MNYGVIFGVFEVNMLISFKVGIYVVVNLWDYGLKLWVYLLVWNKDLIYVIKSWNFFRFWIYIVDMICLVNGVFD